MDVSALAAKLIIFLIPGVIAAKIVQTVTSHKQWTEFQFILNAILLGSISYLVLQVLVFIPFTVDNYSKDSLLLPTKTSLSVWSNLVIGSDIPYREVLWCTPIGIVVGCVVSFIDSYRLINRAAQRLRLSNKYGNENLYSHFLGDEKTQVVYVRHAQLGLTFHGNIVSYSETEEIKEIVLSDVIVYHSATSEELYNSDQVYLSLPKDNVLIETANLLIDEQESGSPEDSEKDREARREV